MRLGYFTLLRAPKTAVGSAIEVYVMHWRPHTNKRTRFYFSSLGSQTTFFLRETITTQEQCDKNENLPPKVSSMEPFLVCYLFVFLLELDKSIFARSIRLIMLLMQPKWFFYAFNNLSRCCTIYSIQCTALLFLFLIFVLIHSAIVVNSASIHLSIRLFLWPTGASMHAARCELQMKSIKKRTSSEHKSCLLLNPGYVCVLWSEHDSIEFDVFVCLEIHPT